MNTKEYIDKMKNIEENFVIFLNQEDHEEENFSNLIKIINNAEVRTNRYDFKIILYLINRISTNHYRNHNFFKKIDQILKTFKSEITQFYSNKEIFKIFKSSKRILLFLIEEKILTFDQFIYTEIMKKEYRKKKYPEYFAPEIKPFIDEEIKMIRGDNEEEEEEEYSMEEDEFDYYLINERIKEILNEDFEEFNEKRKKGENDGQLCKIIQNDLIEEFIIYVNKETYPLNSYIEGSIFETNALLLKNETILIEYAAFYGSIQIFRYLYKNEARVTSILKAYAIHGCDPEIIQIIGENQVFNEVDIKESIKCHHNYITNYIEEHMTKDNENIDYICLYGLKYYNFTFIGENDINNRYFLLYASKYDYFKIVEFLINTKKIDIFNSDDIGIIFIKMTFYLHFNGILYFLYFMKHQ